jgi:DNA polymerase III subunit epsilon
VAILFTVTLAVALGTGALLVAAAGADERRMLLQLLSARAALLIFGALLLAGVCYGIAKWFHAEYVAAARALAEQTEIALGVNDSLRISSGGATELAVLATAIGRLAEEKHRLRIDVDVRAQEQRRRLEEERNRLAALMSELSEGVLVCNTACRILLYN